jgi:small GTP-binding protein
MIKKKICLLGGFSVGKTSLVGRFVKSEFSEKYQTTVGVKVDQKMLRLGGEDIMLMLWDIQGEDGVQPLRPAYLRGSAGFIIVVDGTRGPTLEVAQVVQKKAEEMLGPLPFVALLNKADLEDKWDLAEDTLGRLAQEGWLMLKTSAKTGQNVEEAFRVLAQKMAEESQDD